jgi:CBS domain-containing protein
MQKTQARQTTRVKDLMTKQVSSCIATSTLAEAARIMWEHDCGAVPVLDETGWGRVVGMITDRDIAMGAYLQGKPLAEMCVLDVMARGLNTCTPDESLERAAETMASAQVRRLPVIDEGGRLVGLLTLAQIARASDGDGRDGAAAQVGHTLSRICAPRSETESHG